MTGCYGSRHSSRYELFNTFLVHMWYCVVVIAIEKLLSEDEMVAMNIVVALCGTAAACGSGAVSKWVSV